ncbi:phosphatase PAP2 family protein [Planctomicrobium sp. SH661]|uniref:phosphatase PAP2 family protein n=1 Tax=Planctomicrobium sp. SH661 TaxID=3448124 RepID=UPI003F5AE66C
MSCRTESAQLHWAFRNLLLCTLLVLICYSWIDRPVAFFVYRHQLNHIELFRWLTYPPPIFQAWAPVVIIVLTIRSAWKPLERWQQVLLIASLNMIVADQFRTSLGDVCGRYWPETWFDNNPSLIGTGTYGFHPFVHGDDIGSFPSGHACRILAFVSIWWIAIPQSRVFLLLIAPPMLLSLIAMDYHFVGDVVAGATLGGVLGRYAARWAKLNGSDASVKSRA